MSDYFLNLIQKVIGFAYPRKRRSIHDDCYSSTPKMRRLDSRLGFLDTDDWKDFPRERLPIRKSPIEQPIRQRDFLSPLHPRSLNTEIINIDDDDDVRPRSNTFSRTLLEARRTIKNSQKFCNEGNLNSRHNKEQEQIFPTSAGLSRFPFMENNRSLMMLNMAGAAHKNKSIVDVDLTDDKSSKSSNGFSSDVTELESAYMEHRINACSSFRKLLNRIEERHKRKQISTVIDLTNDKNGKLTNGYSLESELESAYLKHKVSPVNSLKKTLDSEPVMDPDYVDKVIEEYKQKSKNTEQIIEEERSKCNQFNARNRENISCLLAEHMKTCKVSDVIIVDSEDEELSFPQFTDKQVRLINEALGPASPNRVFIEKFNLKITGRDLKLFNEKEWLNDEVINFYVNMIQERSHTSSKLPKVYAFNTFFYSKLVTNGYNSLRRWTKRVDLFAHDLIIIPVHLGYHWCLATIDFRDKSIRYYDSMLCKNMQCLQALENYLQEEHKDKKKADYNTSDWKKILLKDIPRQMNGNDCGVFSCTFAEFVARNAKILFTQEHMPYIRRKMALEIMEGKLLT